MKRKAAVEVARDYSDYEVTPKAEAEAGLKGVTLLELL